MQALTNSPPQKKKMKGLEPPIFLFCPFFVRLFDTAEEDN